MNDILTDSSLCHRQGDLMRALALNERDRTRQRILFALSEQYYLLHDDLVELERLGFKFTHSGLTSTRLN